MLTNIASNAIFRRLEFLERADESAIQDVGCIVFLFSAVFDLHIQSESSTWEIKEPFLVSGSMLSGLQTESSFTGEASEIGDAAGTYCLQRCRSCH